MPGSANTLQEVYATPDQDTLYYCGTLQLNDVSWWASNSIMRLTAQGWDTIGVVHGIVYSVVHWHDTLVVGGAFTSVNDSPYTYLAAYVNNEWIRFGSVEDPSVRKLRVINDELYAVGGFQRIDGDTTVVGIAVRKGGRWHRVGNSAAQLDPVMLDVTASDGSLAVIGTVGNEVGRGIMQLVDSTWQLIGPGIQGGLSGAHSIMEYQGDLYVGGQLRMGEGNAGQDIMRWDGNQFHPLGSGLQRNLGDIATFSDCRAMQVHDGLLFVGGGFRFAGGIPADGVAVWDGSQWCGVPGTLTQGTDYVKSIAFYQDTLFVACGWLADGDSVNQAARFIGTTYVDSCTGPLSVLEPSSPSTFFIYPNPANEQVMIDLSPETRGAVLVDITDALGRTVWRTPWRNQPVDVRPLPTGVYQITLRDEQGRPVEAGRFVKE